MSAKSKRKRILQDVKTLYAPTQEKLDEYIANYANKMGMPIKTVSISLHTDGLVIHGFYATVVLEEIPLDFDEFDDAGIPEDDREKYMRTY